jgi:hypothetical protein
LQGSRSVAMINQTLNTGRDHMNKKLSHPMNRLAILLGLALSAMGAQAADLVSATASVSNLRYRLIDLDLNDGITPSLSVSGALSGRVDTSIKITPDGINNFGSPYIYDINPADWGRSIVSPLFGSTGTLELLSSAPGARVALGNTLSTSTGVSATGVADSLTTFSSSYTYNGVDIDASRGDNLLRAYTETATTSKDTLRSRQASYAQSLPDQTPDVIDPDTGGVLSYGKSIPNLTLSAHTLLVIEGTASLGLHIDQAGLSAAVKSALVGFDDGFYASYAGVADVNLSLALDDPDNANVIALPPGGAVLYKQQTDAFSLVNGIRMQRYGGNTEDLSAIDAANTQDFVLSVANFSGSAAQKMLSINLNASTGMDGDHSRYSNVTTWGDPISEVPLPTPTPGIPEPATGALMGLGLLSMLGLARRQRRSALAARPLTLV